MKPPFTWPRRAAVFADGRQPQPLSLFDRIWGSKTLICLGSLP